MSNDVQNNTENQETLNAEDQNNNTEQQNNQTEKSIYQEAAEQEANSYKENQDDNTDDSSSEEDSSGDSEENNSKEDKKESSDDKEKNDDDKKDSDKEDDKSELKEEDYNFDIPDEYNNDFTKERLEKAKSFFIEEGIKPEDSQKYVNYYIALQKEAMEHQKEAWLDTLETWKEEIKNDKEIGGNEFDKKVGIAKKALDKLGTPELTELLEQSGYGNHPEIIRLFFKIGKSISPDGNITAGSSTQGGSTSIEKRLYPNLS